MSVDRAGAVGAALTAVALGLAAGFADDPGDDPLDRVLPQFEIPALPMDEIAALVTAQTGLRVNMESILYDYSDPKTFVSLAERIEELQAKAAGPGLGPWEKSLLAHYRRVAEDSKDAPADIRVDVRRRLLADADEPVVLKRISPRRLLDELVRRDPDYQWEASEPGIVRLLPVGGAKRPYRNSALGWAFPGVDTGPEGVTLKELLRSEDVAAALAKQGVTIGESEWISGNERVVAMIPPGTTARDAFDQVVAGMGTGVRWHVHRTSETTLLTISLAKSER